MATQVLAGLDHIHRRGLLHRDISPDNVMLSFDADEHLIAKIIDLGVAKDVSGPNVDTTQAGVFIGNPKYMSPEQLGELEEGEALDGRADLYSLGVVLYEMLTGVPPFVARTPNSYIVKHLTEAPRTFQDANPILDAAGGTRGGGACARWRKTARSAGRSAREFAEALAPFASRDRGGFTQDRACRGCAPRRSRPRSGDAAEAWAAAHGGGHVRGVSRLSARSFPMYHAEEAERAIDERLDFDAAAALDTEEAWSVVSRSAGRTTPCARRRRERLEAARVREETAYSVALEMKSADRLAGLSRRVPRQRAQRDSGDLLREPLAYEEARRADTVAAWGLFLLNIPTACAITTRASGWMAGERGGASRAGAPRDRRRRLQRRVREGTVAAWDEYLAQYPDAPRAEEARRARRKRRSTSSPRA